MVHFGAGWMSISFKYYSVIFLYIYVNSTNVIFYVKMTYQAFQEHSYRLLPGSNQVFSPLPDTEGLFEMLNVFVSLLAN